jgi:hypothetical protein
MSTQPNNPIPARSKRRLVNVTYDPEPRRDVIRAGISFGLVAAFLIIICFAMYSTHADFDKTEKMVDKLLPALTGLIDV